MTRAFIPSQPAAGFDRFASLAQSLRTPSADLATDSANFGDLLSEASQPKPSESATPETPTHGASEQGPADRAESQPEPDEAGQQEDQPRDEFQSERPSDEPQSSEPSATSEGEVRVEVEPEALPTDNAAKTNESSQSTETPRDQTADPALAADQPQQEAGAQAEPEVAVSSDAGQPAQSQADAPKTASDADPELQTSQLESKAPEANAQSPRVDASSAEPNQPQTQAADASTEQRAAATREQSIQAPSAEDQKRESIAVETRFDAAIRDKVQNAAKIDLAALAAEKLTSPTQRIPGDLREVADPAPTAQPRQTVSQPASRTIPQAQPEAPAVQTVMNSEAPQAKTPTDSRPAEASSIPTTPSQSSANANTSNSGGESGTRSSTPQAQSVPVAGAAVAATATTTNTNAKSFDRAITALRALGATPGKVKSQAVKGQHATDAQSSSGADRSRPLLTQVSRGVASILRQEGGSLSLKLRPDTLGELKINLRVQNGAVEATFKADNAQARDLLQSTLSQLKETLETNGVRVDRLRVELADTRSQDAAAPRSEHQGTSGDGSPSFENPSETGGRGGESRQDRHGSQHKPHGRGDDQSLAEPEREKQHAGLDAEALRDEQWIGVDTLA